MSHANSAPVNTPASLYSTAGPKSPHVDRRTLWTVPSRSNSAHDVFQFPAMSLDEPLTLSIEWTPSQHKKKDPSEEPHVQLL